jgi:DNA-binding NtrC family response regulator
MADGVKNQAAEILSIKRTTLIEKLKKKKIEG